MKKKTLKQIYNTITRNYEIVNKTMFDWYFGTSELETPKQISELIDQVVDYGYIKAKEELWV